MGVHHQVDGAATGIADVTAVAVAGGGERQRWVEVVVEGAKCLASIAPVWGSYLSIGARPYVQ